MCSSWSHNYVGGGYLEITKDLACTTVNTLFLLSLAHQEVTKRVDAPANNQRYKYLALSASEATCYGVELMGEDDSRDSQAAPRSVSSEGGSVVAGIDGRGEYKAMVCPSSV